MDKAQKAALALVVSVTIFVLATAVYTGNGALYLLAALACLIGLRAWQQHRSGA